MNKRLASVAVVGGMVLAGAFAAFQTHASPTSDPALLLGPTATSPEQAPALPPNHPRIGGAANALGPGSPEPASDAPSIAWMPPPGWVSVPNPSPMRIATYRIPRTAGDNEDAELSVMRAGGTAEANAERWVGQFDGTPTQARQETTVQGFKVTVISVRGTFLGGGMTKSAPSPRPSWGLLGAIVETPGSPYFFKMLGPTSTVSAARPSFDAMIAKLSRL
jgi:hypothetical protein